MENRDHLITLAVQSLHYEDVTTPGVIVEVEPDAAEGLGAFEESALTEEEAWESNTDLAEDGTRG